MAPRTNSAAAAPTAPLEALPAEHIYIGSEEPSVRPETARAVRHRTALHNKLRGTHTEITIFDEGIVKVVESRRRQTNAFHLDLRYLDPVPTLTRVISVRALYVALAAGAVAPLATYLTSFEILRPFALPTAIAAGVTAAAALVVALYRSHERTEFRTIHGRAPVLKLIANLGSIRPFRAFVPVLNRAIEEAAQQIGDDTAAYLRAEMREHYRLRGDGVLSSEDCAESTGRILAQFEVQL